MDIFFKNNGDKLEVDKNWPFSCWSWRILVGAFGFVDITEVFSQDITYKRRSSSVLYNLFHIMYKRKQKNLYFNKLLAHGGPALNFYLSSCKDYSNYYPSSLGIPIQYIVAGHYEEQEYNW